MKHLKLFESITKIKCEHCGKHSWNLSSGGEDPYTCHKCGGIHSEIFKFASEPSDWYKPKVGSESIEKTNEGKNQETHKEIDAKVLKLAKEKLKEKREKLKGIGNGVDLAQISKEFKMSKKEVQQSLLRSGAKLKTYSSGGLQIEFMGMDTDK